MSCRVEAASSVGHVTSACCVDTLAGLSELLRCHSHTTKLRWNGISARRVMGTEALSVIRFGCRLLPCDRCCSTGAQSVHGVGPSLKYREACMKDLWKKIARRDEK